MLRTRSTFRTAAFGLALILGAGSPIRAEDRPAPDPGAETARALLKARQDNLHNQMAGRPSVWMWAPRDTKLLDRLETQTALPLD